MAELWAAAQQLAGRWEGPATGRPGKGRQVREYRSILAGHFVLGTDETRWEPNPEEPNGSLHEGLAVLSFDRPKGELVMRNFYSEGFIHEYRCRDSGDVFSGPDSFESTFELAVPGGDFEKYTFERLRRIG